MTTPLITHRYRVAQGGQVEEVDGRLTVVGVRFSPERATPVAFIDGGEDGQRVLELGATVLDMCCAGHAIPVMIDGALTAHAESFDLWLTAGDDPVPDGPPKTYPAVMHSYLWIDFALARGLPHPTFT